MFDYSNGFAATGTIGGYTFNVGNNPYNNPYGFDPNYQPILNPYGVDVRFVQRDNTMLYVLLAVVAVVILSK